MTLAQERFLARVRARLRSAEPPVRAAYLRALRELAESMPMRELETLIATRSVDAILRRTFSDDVLARAFAPVRATVQHTLTTGILTFAREVPGTTASTINTAFGIINPRVVEAVRTLDTKLTARLSDVVRGGVREVVERGYVDGQGPRTTARELRRLIGLGESEVQQVGNFRDALMGRNGRDWRSYAKRDRRFDGTIERALRTGVPLTDEQIERMVGAYEKRRIALAAEANARTATLDAMKSAQDTTWQTAIADGIVDAKDLNKQWTGTDDGRERPAHVAMNGQVVPFQAPYSNGQMIPGETDYSCRCWSRIFVGAS